MSANTIEHGPVQIPIESLAGDGVVVLELGSNAYLLVRANDLTTYPTEKLEQLRAITQTLARSPGTPTRYHPSKVRALREMRALGIPVSGGEEYFSELVTNPPSIEQVRKELASIKGNLSDFIIAERDEQ
ncbi:MAG: hypothetical protein KGJ80_03020 [Chloroflexota bacterium]|nr:hypothetical protein [Chloroflexota bacterium]